MTFSFWSGWISCFACVYLISSHRALPHNSATLKFWKDEAIEINSSTGEIGVSSGGNRPRMKYHTNIMTQHLCGKKNDQ
jgi:hypothetical protein